MTCDTALRIARIASGTSLLFALVYCSIAIRNAASLVRTPRIDSLVRFSVWHLSFRFDLVESFMLLLVSFLEWVIVNYSRAYMAGDPREPSYVAHLMLTLAAVRLPLQSLHDGHTLRHIPLRLSVFIEAPQSSIGTVIQNHEVVRDLVQNQWIHLFQITPESETFAQYRDGIWDQVKLNDSKATKEETIVSREAYA